jgi:hypothetical protein
MMGTAHIEVCYVLTGVSKPNLNRSPYLMISFVYYTGLSGKN